MNSRTRLLSALAVMLLIGGSVAYIISAVDDQRCVLGTWQGLLRYPGLETRLVLRIYERQDGELAAAVLLPDQSEEEHPAQSAVVSGHRLQFAVPAMRAGFDGKFDSQQARLKGRWEQNGRTQTVMLTRVRNVRVTPRPQTPKPPFPYLSIEVSYAANPAARAVLAGTLTSPRADGPFPAVLLVSGGGAQDRDGTILGHRPFFVLADYLTRHGIAVLRVDDRGVGASTGDRANATSQDYAQDALAGVGFLKGYPTIDPDRIGLIGHSEGGVIASLAAAASPEIAFIVLLASPGLPGAEYHLQYETSTGRALGLSEESIVAKRVLQRRVLELIQHERDAAAADRELRALLKEANPEMPDARVDAAVRRFLSPWFRFSVRHDPGETLRGVRCPVLALFGEKDVQVPADGNLEAIRKSLSAAGTPESVAEVLPGLNHLFQECKTGSPTEYGRIDQTFSPAALARIRAWILKQVGR